ncbi:dipeptide/oligopeptide/nickel ABC transporter permease/ATP-binding protein [Microbacterium sp. NPDC089318]
MSADILTAVDEISADRAAARTSRGAWRNLVTDPQAVISGAIILLYIVVGVCAPLLATHDPNTASLDSVNAPVGELGHILGADQSGRDIFSRLVLSVPTSLIAAMIGVGMALAVGVTFGLIGGYGKKFAQSSTEWVFSLIMTFPGLLLVIALIPLTGGDYRWTMAIFGVLLAPGVYRIVRNMVLGVKKELYVDAARVSGVPDRRILSRHILFVVRSPIIIAATFLAGSAISIQAGLAFLGLGDILLPSFGGMISAAFQNFYKDPTQLIWPCLGLGLLTASLVLFGNSLRDALEGARPKPVPFGRRGRRAAAPVPQEDGALLSVTDLAVSYPVEGTERKTVVRGVDITIRPGEILGLVGESGSGKTQTAFSILGVLPREAEISSGSVLFQGRDLAALSEKELERVRGGQIAYIPQEPMSNLDPSYTVGAQLVEGLRASVPGLSRAEAKARMLEMLARVEIVDPERVFAAYPHEISGGMAQRVLIAGAVASRPALLIADEPTTALDVTVQAEILDLIRDLQAEMGMAVLLVTHNFGVVADICSRVAVMQNGSLIEEGGLHDIFARPQHPYTQALLAGILDETSVRTDPPRAGREVVEVSA